MCWATTKYQNSFCAPSHSFYKSLKLYWRHGTPFFRKVFPSLGIPYYNNPLYVIVDGLLIV